MSEQPEERDVASERLERLPQREPHWESGWVTFDSSCDFRPVYRPTPGGFLLFSTLDNINQSIQPLIGVGLRFGQLSL